MNKQLWVDYISAAVHLYGIAPFGQVAEMISSQTGEEVSEHDIKQWIEDPFRGSLAQAALQKKFVYLYRGDFFVAEWIAIFDEFDDHWARQQGKPFYVPEQEELLLWSDPHYFHKPDQYYALVEFIETKFAGVSEEYVQGIAEDIQMMAEDPFSLERVLSEFERRDLNLTAKQIQSLMQIVTDLHNNTRQQVNRGHTPYELLQLEKTSLRPLPVGQVGRNDPCPCGSGKKYKKCCGK